MKRRLTTILAADIVGFSRLVGADEESAILFQRILHAEVIDPLLARHNGRIANTAGDSLLIEFPSAVEGVRFAMAMQSGVAARNEKQATDARMEYRIGINVGDVIENGGDILGDGVNIAARLEALAPSGGIVLSRTARDQVRHLSEINLADRGEITVKNIARPQRAFQVLRDGEAPVQIPQTRRPRSKLIAAVVALTVTAGVASWWSQRSDFTPVAASEMAYALPAKPSVAVLPFLPLGLAAADDWIGDGITENIISTLALSPETFVIGRTSSFAYKGQDVTASEVAADLGVRYVLSGSVQADGKRLRITAELDDAVKGQRLWSIRQDGGREDLFDLQDAIAEKLYEEMNVSLTLGEDARRLKIIAGDFETLRLMHEARALFQTFSREGHLKALEIAKRLVREHPDRAPGYTSLSWLSWQKPVLGMSTDRVADNMEAISYAEKAISILEYGDPWAAIASAQVNLGDFDRAIQSVERALELAPSGNDVLGIAGYVKVAGGDYEEGIDLMLRAMRVEPDNPGWLPAQIGYAYLAINRYAEAKAVAKAVLSSETDDITAKPLAKITMIAADALSGDLSAAREEARSLPVGGLFATVQSAGGYHAGKRDQAFHERYVKALIEAGVPES